MQLAALIRGLGTADGAALALEGLGDLVLHARVTETGAQFGEPPEVYIVNAVRRFAARAGDEDWMRLVTAIERGPDPTSAALRHMLSWALGRDADELAGAETACACSGPHGGGHGHP